MTKDNRLLLYLSNILVMISGFLIPIYITRSLSNHSDLIFFYLSILNPVIILFGLDQRKKIILGSEGSYDFHSNIRLGFVTLIFVISTIYIASTNSYFFYPILFIKLISFSLDIHNGVLQNENNFIKLLFLRIFELLLILILILLNSSYSIILLIFYLFYLIYNWRFNLSSSAFEFIRNNYPLGLQGTLAAASSGLGIYVLKVTQNNHLITELAVQSTILAAVYMTQSIYLNSILDKFKKIGYSKTIKKLVLINCLFVIGGGLFFFASHFLGFYDIIFNYDVDFSYLSIYAFLFISIHMMKNSQVIFSFLIKREVLVSKFKFLINLLYVLPLFLPLNVKLKLIMIISISFIEFLITFKLVKR